MAQFSPGTVGKKMSIIKTWENFELINLHNRGDCIGIVRENFEIFILNAKIDDAQQEGVPQFSLETVGNKMSIIIFNSQCNLLYYVGLLIRVVNICIIFAWNK